jgi:hypothetical protein
VVAATLIASCGADDEAAVLQSFSNYKEAILAGEGERAADLVTDETLAYYEQIRRLAVSAGREEIRQRRLIDRLSVAYYRVLIGPESLRAMTGRDVFVFGVDNGLIGRSDAINLEIGEVAVEGDSATAPVVVRGETTPIAFEFTRENDQWKVDLEALLRLTDFSMQQVVQDAGVSEDAFILDAVEASSGERVTNEVWDRPT